MMGVTPLSTLPLSSLLEAWDIFASFDLECEMDVSSEYAIRVSTDTFITRADDDPANTPFDGGLLQPLSFRRSIMGSDFGGLISAQGEILLDNSDGSMDDQLVTFSFEDTEVDVRVGEPDSLFSSRYTVFQGIALVEEVDRTELRIPVVDRARWLDIPLTEAVYAGTGGAEGGEDIEGKRRPISLGYNENVSPPQLDANKKLYQSGNGQGQAIPAVYASGVTLNFQEDFATVGDLLAAEIEDGKYATCLAETMFRLEFELQGTVVTNDVHGTAEDGFVGTVGTIIRRLAEWAGVEDFDEAAFEAFEQVHGYQAGAWFDHNDTSTIADAMARIAGYGVWFGFRRDGRFSIGRIKAPDSYPSLYISEIDILDDAGGIDRNPLPEGLIPAPWRWRVPWGRNNTVQTGADVAGSVSESRKTWLSEQVRLATAENTAIRAASRTPRDRDPVPGALRNKADAEAEAARLLALFGTTRSLYRITIGREGHVLDIGSVVNVTYPRWNLDDGRDLLVVDIDEDAATGRITFIGFC